MRIARAPRSRAGSAKRRSRAMSAKARCRPASSIPIWPKALGHLRRRGRRERHAPRRHQVRRREPHPRPAAPRANGRRHGRLRQRGESAIARPPAARGPRRIPRSAVMDAAPAAAAGQIRRRPHARHQVRLRPQGRPADGDQGTGRRRAAQRPHPGAARRHRLGQDLHHGQGDRTDAAPGADPGAEQDAGGAALRRVQEFLSRQRGRIFRQLLRLLPAGSLYPAHRHLYREGFLDQRADRPHAPLGDARAAGARRRHHRRLGVVHLRHRLGRDLFGDDVHHQARREAEPAPAARRSGGAAIQAHRRRFLSRLVPRARRRHRDFPGALRGPRLAGVAVRRRGGIDPRIRSAHRAKDRRAGIRQNLRQFALRDAAADAAAGDFRHQARIAAAARPAQRRRAPARSAAARAAHALRSRNDGGDRRLRRHRELFALSDRAEARRAAADLVRIRARQCAGVRRREPRHRAAARRHVSRRLPPQGDARRIRLPPAVVHGQPAAALRGMGRDAAADHLPSRRRRGRGSSTNPAACSPSR